MTTQVEGGREGGREEGREGRTSGFLERMPGSPCASLLDQPTHGGGVGALEGREGRREGGTEAEPKRNRKHTQREGKQSKSVPLAFLKRCQASRVRPCWISPRIAEV